MADNTVQGSNQPDQMDDETSVSYHVMPEPVINEDLLLPAAFTARVRKRDRLIAPYTYRRPRHLQYIEYS